MIKKLLRDSWGLVRDKLNQVSFPIGSMRYIIGYAVLVAGCCLLYVVAWCIDWYTTGKPDMQELRQFLHEIASAPWIALLGFVARVFIDKDKDGIPDEFENSTPLENKTGK